MRTNVIGKGDLAGRRILLVEDEPLEALDYADRLGDEGAEIVGPFALVADAMACVEREHVDAAVIDFALADDTSEALQAALSERDIPFIVLTGHPRRQVEATSSARHVLSKPVSYNLLCASVRALAG